MAAVFRFRLQRVLELREHTLRARRLELAAALAAERQAEDTLRQAREERVARDRALRAVDDGPTSVLTLRARLVDTEAYARREDVLQQRLDALRKATQTARAAAVEAHRQVEVVERLREKAHARWRDEVRTQEFRAQDDIPRRYGDDPFA